MTRILYICWNSMQMSPVRVYSKGKKFSWVPAYAGTGSCRVQSLTNGTTHMLSLNWMFKFFSELKVECWATSKAEMHCFEQKQKLHNWKCLLFWICGVRFCCFSVGVFFKSLSMFMLESTNTTETPFLLDIFAFP